MIHIRTYTKLRSNIVVETDTETRGRGDAEKMNVLRMNATWYNALPSLWGEMLISRWLKRRKFVNFSQTDERAISLH